MGLFFVGLGSLFVLFLWAAYQKAKAMDVWIETPAEILRSEVIDWRSTKYTNAEFKADLRYRYEFGGKSYESTQIKIADGPSGERKRIEKKIKPYPAGSTVSAFVNPANPAQAVLKRNTKAAIYTVWFPMIFVIGGIGVIVSALRPGRGGRSRQRATQ